MFRGDLFEKVIDRENTRCDSEQSCFRVNSTILRNEKIDPAGENLVQKRGVVG